MPIKKVFTKGKVPIKIWTDEIDSKTIDQLVNCSKMPFIHKWVAGMPDVHLGIGATVGSVIPTKGAIIPSAVGVDIGCGMVAARTNLHANDIDASLKGIREEIENIIPLGPGAKHGRKLKPIAKPLQNGWDNTQRRMVAGLEAITHKHPTIIKRMKSGAWRGQLGTLGGGNHFIEVCLDEQDMVWVMMHSGSRGIGNKFGQYFIHLAKKDMERHHIHNLPDKDLSYLSEGTDYFNDYIEAVTWAQEYALENRNVMFNMIMLALAEHLPKIEVTDEVINCHHNYIAREHHYGENVWVTRKGAIRARTGDLGIIPGSMGAKSFIVSGRGNNESFSSCSHGAGRKFSRSKAKQLFTTADLVDQTAGIECRKDEGVLDEIPGCYKDIDQVMDNQSDLVDIKHTLRQIINVKG